MNSTRISIVCFILAAAIGPALLVSYFDASDAAAVQAGPESPAPAVVQGERAGDIAPPIPPGLKALPWAGTGDGRMQVGNAPVRQTTPARAVDAPVVVELFTSEGCSSCPPADKLLSELAMELQSNDRIYFLAYHVDYWDHIGWKDPYASNAATARQRAYAKAFGSSDVYTPQMVVGGTTGFVGSDRVKAREAIEAAKKVAGRVTVTATMAEALAAGKASRIQSESVVTGVDAKLPVGMKILAALIEDGLESKVTAGENKSRTLKHDRVVRAFADSTVDAEGKAEVELLAPPDIKPERCRVVVLAQDGATLKVLGACTAAVAVKAPTPVTTPAK